MNWVCSSSFSSVWATGRVDRYWLCRFGEFLQSCSGYSWSEYLCHPDGIVLEISIKPFLVFISSLVLPLSLFSCSLPEHCSVTSLKLPPCSKTNLLISVHSTVQVCGITCHSGWLVSKICYRPLSLYMDKDGITMQSKKTTNRDPTEAALENGTHSFGRLWQSHISPGHM